MFSTEVVVFKTTSENLFTIVGKEVFSLLEQNDLEMIRTIMQETLNSNNNAILSKVDNLRETTVKHMDEINKNGEYINININDIDWDN